jgi:deoxyribose-phosphate aldolase
LTTDAVAAGCQLARELGLRAVVVRSCDVELVTQWTRGSSLVVAGAVCHPDGTATTAAKLFEARDLLRLGAKEIEFPLNPARMLSRQFQHIETELLQIATSCHESGARLTAVYNNRWFTDDLKIIVTKICRRVEADVISVDHTEGDLKLLTPMLKDVLRMKHATRVSTLEEALAARADGYISVATTEPRAVLTAWKEHLSAAAQPSQS